MHEVASDQRHIHVLDDENAHFYYNGEEIPVNVAPAEKLTAETIIAYDVESTLHVVITPEVGTQEAVEETKVVYEDKPLKDTSFNWLTTSVHDSVTEINNAAAALDEYRQKVEEFKEAGTDTNMNGIDQVLRNQQGDLVQMIDDLSYREDDMQALANYALNLWQALNSVHGGCAKENIASARAMEKGGMAQYGTEENGDLLFRYRARNSIGYEGNS